MFGYATNETKPRCRCHDPDCPPVFERLAGPQRTDGTLPYLRPRRQDPGHRSAPMASRLPSNGSLISTQHAPDVDNENNIRPDLLENVVSCRSSPRSTATRFDENALYESLLINPTGSS